MQIRQEKGCYTLYKENEAIGTAVVDGTTILRSCPGGVGAATAVIC